MSDMAEGINCGGFVFYNNFDSANLAKVEEVDVNERTDNDGCNTEDKFYKNGVSEDIPGYEFNLWTKHDCHGTEYLNNNRTWFYFGIKAAVPEVNVKLNVINLNKQMKMFSQGMCPVYKVIPGHPQWDRIRDKPVYALDEKSNEFTLSFIYRTPENTKAISYFAFTYPFAYTDLQTQLKKIDARMSQGTITSVDDIYYHRECVVKSLEGRRLELLTISSYQNISTEREDRLKNLFPDKEEDRSFKFENKKVIFVSARVHPGETPSSFVLNGLLNLLLNREDQIAINLRRHYVFKLIPMLNPDGVARGHYRMDTRGVNLNRVYLNPSEKDHPTIFAARSLIRYYHNYYKLPEETEFKTEISNDSLEMNRENMNINKSTGTITNVVRDTANRLLEQVTLMTLDEKSKNDWTIDKCHKKTAKENFLRDESQEPLVDKQRPDTADNKKTYTVLGVGKSLRDTDDSGLFLYIDLHGHASKKGIFMYGNYFDDPEESMACMLLPKLMSMNNPNFHFTSCNFAEKNMYLIDKRDGMSREGSGRVAVYKLTGLIRSYTLECNYNSGRLVNTLPARVKDSVSRTQGPIFVPPKYTPAVYEEVGAALGPSILDMTNSNPNSRLPNSQYRSLRGVKSYLKINHVNNSTGSSKKLFHKDNSGVSAASVNTQNYNPAEKLETKLNSVSTEIASSSTKRETSFVKKPCMVRKTTSLYTAIKKIKNNKKPRQIIIRKPPKFQGSMNQKSVAQSSYLHSEIQSKTQMRVKKKFSKFVNNYSPTMETNCLEDKCTIVETKRRKPIVKNTTKQNVSAEITAVVKQGSKRLKVVSPKLIRARPEIGESPNTNIVNKKTKLKSSKTLYLCNKQKSKGTFTKNRKQCLKVDQKKSKKSSKIMKNNRDKPEASESSNTQISSDTTN